MEQIQFIYFQDYMQYYTVHHKENTTYMEIWQLSQYLTRRKTTKHLKWFSFRPLTPQ